MTSSIAKTDTTPVVLCFSGHDPGGGAGIQADIEAIAAQDAHAATVVTALTMQDSCNVQNFTAVDATQMQAQAELILEDMKIAAIKIGMTADAAIIDSIGQVIAQHTHIPVILDPVLASGGGDSLSSQSLIKAIREQIVPHCRLLTPNIPEALALTGCANIDDAAKALLSTGAKAVLITGTHSDEAEITHRLYQPDNRITEYKNTRLPYEYHGSGCTLTSSLAALIAEGTDLESAVKKALDYTFQCLQQARSLGKCQLLPNRLQAFLKQD